MEKVVTCHYYEDGFEVKEISFCVVFGNGQNKTDIKSESHRSKDGLKSVRKGGHFYKQRKEGDQLKVHILEGQQGVRDCF